MTPFKHNLAVAFSHSLVNRHLRNLHVGSDHFQQLTKMVYCDPNAEGKC
jgi:hypothetical protein